MEQMSIFDILSNNTGDIPCGYTEDLSLIGRELRFTELARMVGKKVVISSTYNSCKNYKVVRILKYFKDSDKIYRQVRELPEGSLYYPERVNDYIHDVVGQKEAMSCYEIEAVCDRVGYTDKEKNREANCGVSEMYCSNGRYEPLNDISETFYELNMI